VIGMPGTYSMTKYGDPSAVVPASKTRAIAGWSISARACRSDSKRAIIALLAMPALINLMATVRCTGVVCSPRQTSAMPPSPIFSNSR